MNRNAEVPRARLPIVTSGLDSFQFLGSALMYRDDKRSLIALDPQTGRRLAERTVDDVHAMVGGAAIPPASDWTIPGADAARIIDASLAAWNAEPEELSLAESRRRLLRLNDAWRIRGETHGRVRLTVAAPSKGQVDVLAPEHGVAREVGHGQPAGMASRSSENVAGPTSFR